MKLTETEQYNVLIKVFKKSHNRTLDIYNKDLQEELGKTPKTIHRIIEKFMNKYHSVVELDDYKRKTYQLITPMDVIQESFDHFEDLAWLFQMAHDANPEILKGIEKYIKLDHNLYLFKNTPFEDIASLESNTIFKTLKRFIEAREYTKIKYFNDDNEYDNLKCIKLAFLDGNWYVAFVDNEDKLQLGRISFIERIEYGTKTEHFQPSSVQKHHNLLAKTQNSMTLHYVDIKQAKIKATPFIAKYFKEGMKKFLSSQKFIEELEDGSIIFSLEYTQPLEILPFIQKWIPDLTILEPQELKEELINKLQSSISNHN